jgi:ribonuclease VapC
VIAVDTSAVVAIGQLEPEAAEFRRCIEEAPSAYLSAVSLQEILTVMLGRRGDMTILAPLNRLLDDMRLHIVGHDAELARLASEAFIHFGKGRHPARLNFGDCASYALAKKYGIPLLFKGTDFAKTDIVPALAAPA